VAEADNSLIPISRVILFFLVYSNIAPKIGSQWWEM